MTDELFNCIIDITRFHACMTNLPVPEKPERNIKALAEEAAIESRNQDYARRFMNLGSE